MRTVGSPMLALLSSICLVSCGGGEGQSAAVNSGANALATSTPAPTPTATQSPASVELTGETVDTSTLGGAPDTGASFPIENGLQPSWGTGAIPDIYDRYEGAFRFTCGGAGKLEYDDPLVYPGQPGKAHLHQPWGNAQFDASTTSATLLQSAETDCNATQYSLNRSSYWMPALINDQGQAIHPDLVSVYYKRKTSASPACTKGSSTFMGTCVGLPNQITFIFGWDSNNPTSKVEGASWYCTAESSRHFTNLDDLFSLTTCKAGDELIANTIAPNCWDGKYLSVSDSRSHMAYPSYGTWGYLKCPDTHPYVIPQEENKATYTVTADMIGIRSDGSRYSRIRLSSDAMLPGAKPGQTLHADYIEAWITEAKDIWLANCIEKGLSCNGGDLGNGKQLIGAARPTYGWKNPNPREPIPEA